MDAESDDLWSSERRDSARNQARALTEGARLGGLTFEAYFPPELALWLLSRIEDGTFIDPSEAIFTFVSEIRGLIEEADIRRDLLLRRLQRAENDPSPRIDADLVFDELRKILESPRPDSVTWIVDRRG